MTSQKKRHKITLSEVRKQLEMHQSQKVTLSEWRWFEQDEHEILFVTFFVPLGAELESITGRSRLYRWQVFENGTIAAGGIVG